MISCAVMKMRTAALKRSTSNAPSALLELHQVQRGEVAGGVVEEEILASTGWWSSAAPVPLQVCHLWIVVSNCMPGSPQTCVPSAILRSSVARVFLLARLAVGHALASTIRVPSIAASMNSSLTRTVRFSF